MYKTYREETAEVGIDKSFQEHPKPQQSQQQQEKKGSDHYQSILKEKTCRSKGRSENLVVHVPKKILECTTFPSFPGSSSIPCVKGPEKEKGEQINCSDPRDFSNTLEGCDSPFVSEDISPFSHLVSQKIKPDGSGTDGRLGSGIHVKMNFSSDLSNSEEYQSFRSTVPLRKIVVESDPSKVWKIYEAGPRTVKCPLVCLAPVSGTADVFYRQLLGLTARGIRVILAESPVFWTVDDFCKGFKRLLDNLDIQRVHLFGASLGGFLAQKFAEYTYNQQNFVASLILCNTFLDTSIFNYNESASVFWILPGPLLKKLVMGNIVSEQITDLSIAQAVDFITERLDTLSQQELASRLTMNCVNCHVDTFKLNKLKMTIVDVFDESALSTQAREDLHRHYTNAKLAHLKTGGNFPYLSRPDEVNMHILIHLRTFNETRYAGQEPCKEIVADLNNIHISPTEREFGNSTDTNPEVGSEATEIGI